MFIIEKLCKYNKNFSNVKFSAFFFTFGRSDLHFLGFGGRIAYAKPPSVEDHFFITLAMRVPSLRR